VDIPPYIGYPLVAVAAAGALYWFANRQVYHPMKHPDGWWEVQDELGAEDVSIETRDGVRLHGWWSPVEDASLAALYLHGNAGNVTHRGSHIRAANAEGCSMLVIDYRGYGKSGGAPSESGLYTDAEAGYELLRSKGYPPERIVVHAESLGTAVAVELAGRVKVAGVILEAPFTSASDVAGRILPLVGPLLVNGFDAKSKIGRLAAPLLVIHGDRDGIIPFDMGETLYEAAPEPKSFWAVPGAGHNDIVESGGEAYRERLREFYKLVGAGGAG